MNLPEPPPLRRRFFQFSLRQLFLLLAVLALLLGIVTPRLHRVFQERQSQNAARRVQQAEVSLVRAVRNDDTSLARRALEAGANPSGVYGDAGSLLYLAIENGCIPMMELLLEYSADVEASQRLNRAPTVGGPPLFAAICCDQPVEARLRMIRLLIQRGADPRREVGRRSAMDCAVYQSEARIADLLRESGAPYGPGEMAAFGRLEELRGVVREDPAVLKQRFRPIWAANPGQEPTLLGIALERGHREMALFLIESGAPLDTLEYLGQTLLHRAARGGDPELIRLLIARGLDVDAKDDYRDTPLRDIAWQGKPEAVSALLEAGAEVNTRGMNQRTPLWSAVSGNQVELVRMLLAAGADPTIPNRDGKTAVDVAQEKDPRIVELLEEAVPAKGPPAQPTRSR